MSWSAGEVTQQRLLLLYKPEASRFLAAELQNRAASLNEVRRQTVHQKMQEQSDLVELRFKHSRDSMFFFKAENRLLIRCFFQSREQAFRRQVLIVRIDWIPAATQPAAQF